MTPAQKLHAETKKWANPHDRLMQRAWQGCREGLAICRRDEAARQKALEFSNRAKAVAPTHMQRWIEILQGEHADHVATLFGIESFFSLMPQEQAWWDQLIQSAPFAPILAPLRQEKIKSRGQKLNRNEQTHMTLEQFDHVCRAAAAVAGVKKVYVFGANAIIPWLAQASHPIPLSGLKPSRELDVSVNDEQLDTLIDGLLGEFSLFDTAFSVYAHGVNLTVFQAPSNWRQRTGKRTEPVNTVEIIVPHPHDLIISKLVAGRQKDFDFAVSVERLFPMTDNVLNELVEEFRVAHLQAEAGLRTNVEIWKNKILPTGNPQD